MTSNFNNILYNDLDHVLEHTEPLWHEVKSKRIFITGGTGFFGCWFLESFAWMNERLNLNAEIFVLTRDYDKFKLKVPHLANNKNIKFHIGDVRSFTFPEGNFDYVIHAATESSGNLTSENPLLMFDTIVSGTQHTLEFAKYCNAKKILMISSGAVYGNQPCEIQHISENYLGAPDQTDLISVYGEGKRVAELLGTIYSKQFAIKVKIARCFSFVGPYLPLRSHFAIGNFIRDGLKGGPIVVNGDGTPYRSYLYAADLMIWLWTILFKGKSIHPYNVGSESSISIKSLAEVVASIFQSNNNIIICSNPVSNKKAKRYIPSTKRAREELDLKQLFNLQDSIKKTIGYQRKIGNM